MIFNHLKKNLLKIFINNLIQFYFLSKFAIQKSKTIFRLLKND
jgi:hypothetical protein